MPLIVRVQKRDKIPGRKVPSRVTRYRRSAVSWIGKYPEQTPFLGELQIIIVDLPQQVVTAVIIDDEHLMGLIRLR